MLFITVFFISFSINKESHYWHLLYKINSFTYYFSRNLSNSFCPSSSKVVMNFSSKCVVINRQYFYLKEGFLKASYFINLLVLETIVSCPLSYLNHFIVCLDVIKSYA